MGSVSGESTIEIDAPVQRCFDLAADPDGTPRWQDSVKRTKVLERDGEGKPTLVETHIHALVKDLQVALRFDWDEPHELRWVRESGDLAGVRGHWRFEDLGGGRTRATYFLDIDPGRMLSMMLRGPLVDQLRRHLTKQPPEGLKQAAEAG